MKRKTELNFYSFYNVTGMQLHLEHMARQGWFLDRITNFGWHYHRDEPKDIHYAVSYYAKASAFEPETSEGQQTFQEFCEHAGWHLAAENAKLQVFRNESDNPVPIYTDPESELDSVQAMAKSTYPAYWVLLGLILIQMVMLVHDFRRSPLEVLSSSLRLASGLSMLLLAVFLASEIVLYYFWRRKAESAAQSGETVPTARTRLQTRPYLLLAAVIILILGFAGTGSPGMVRWFVFYVAGLAALMFAVNAVRILMKKKKVDKDVNRVVTLAVDVVLAAVLTGVMTFDAFHIVRRDDLQAGDKTMITVSDITGEDADAGERRISSSASVFLSRTQGWEYPPEGAEDGRDLGYQIVDVHTGWLKDYCLQALLHENDRLGNYQEDYDPEHPFYCYMETEDPQWQADRVWQFSAYGDLKNTYLLQYGSRFAVLQMSWAPSPAEKARISDIVGM